MKKYTENNTIRYRGSDGKIWTREKIGAVTLHNIEGENEWTAAYHDCWIPGIYENRQAALIAASKCSKEASNDT